MTSLYEMERAIADASATISNADTLATRMAGMIRRRLRHVPSYILKDLKKELRDFNIHTGQWKS